MAKLDDPKSVKELEKDKLSRTCRPSQIAPDHFLSPNSDKWSAAVGIHPWS